MTVSKTTLITRTANCLYSLIDCLIDCLIDLLLAEGPGFLSHRFKVIVKLFQPGRSRTRPLLTDSYRSDPKLAIAKCQLEQAIVFDPKLPAKLSRDSYLAASQRTDHPGDWSSVHHSCAP